MAGRLRKGARRAGAAAVEMQMRRYSGKALCSARAEEYAHKVSDFMQQVFVRSFVYHCKTTYLLL